MSKTQPSNLFSRKLLHWFRQSARDLPWRKTKDPYKIWISEIMLQQTTVSAVIPKYEAWIKKFPDMRSLARAREQTVLKQWQGLGYYNRARNLHATARIICQDHQGILPPDADTLSRLPGFGPYTVGAVLSIAFGIRKPIIDANVRRVSMRVLNLKGAADTSQDKTILAFLERVLPHRSVGDFNEALMELGALICRQTNPLCLQCPVRVLCESYKEGCQELIPTPRLRRIKNISAVVAVIRQNGKFLIQQRTGTKLLQGLWEFPGGKVETGETERDALQREIQEELKVEVSSAEKFMTTDHSYTEFHVTLSVWWCTLKEIPLESATLKWVGKRELLKYPMPSGSAKIVDHLLRQDNN